MDFAKARRGLMAREPARGVESHVGDSSIYSFQQVTVPTEVGVDESILVRAEINPADRNISVLNPDWCPAANGSDGTRIDVNVYLDNVFQSSERFCLPADILGFEAGTRTAEFTLPGLPNEGTASITIEVEGASSGIVVLSETRSVTVTGDSRCPPGQVWDPEQGRCIEEGDVGNGDGGGSDPVQQAQRILLLIAAIVGLAALANVSG